MKTYILKGHAPGEKPAGASGAAAAAVREHVYPDTRRQPISAAELRELGRASAEAFKAYRVELEAEGESLKDFAKRGGKTIKEVQDGWRHAEVKVATAGRASRLRDVMQADFGNVLGHFLNAAGMTAEAFRAMVRGGESRHGEPLENNRQAVRKCEGVLAEVTAHFAEQVRQQSPGMGEREVQSTAAARCGAWLHTIVKWKEAKNGRPWREWASNHQWALSYTLTNRLADLRGEPHPERRNKTQRKRVRTPRAEHAPAPRTSAPVRNNETSTRHFV